MTVKIIFGRLVYHYRSHLSHGRLRVRSLWVVAFMVWIVSHLLECALERENQKIFEEINGVLVTLFFVRLTLSLTLFVNIPKQ